ncbi:hypothetical protein CEXT_520181 [Caerostris extrusa]|uniref:Secreted protein n=1 Tax=Caerostris extrusa TaxID=172846 RepID=A0AAV4UUH7_CAEEX|nr:hypothetical protein CEXT_520181 [Caerostris extrusa]
MLDFFMVFVALSFSPLLGRALVTGFSQTRGSSWRVAVWRQSRVEVSRQPGRAWASAIAATGDSILAACHLIWACSMGSKSIYTPPPPPPFHHSLPIFVCSKNAPSDLFSIFSSAVGLGGDALARYSSWADIGLFKIQFGFMK